MQVDTSRNSCMLDSLHRTVNVNYVNDAHCPGISVVQYTSIRWESIDMKLAKASLWRGRVEPG